MNIAQAKQIPLEVVLKAIGAVETKRDERSIWYQSPIREGDNDASFKVNVRENIFYDFGTAQYGDVINLVREHRGGNVSEALQWLKQFAGQLPLAPIERPPSKPTAPTVEPQSARRLYPGRSDRRYAVFNEGAKPQYEIIRDKYLNNHAMLAYVVGRGIPPEIARQYLREVYFRHSDSAKRSSKNLFGLGFPNNAKGFEVRSIQGDFKACIGHKALSYINYDSLPEDKQGHRPETLHCFEGMFDFLTFARLIPPHPGARVLVLNSTTLAHRAVEYIKEFPTVIGVPVVYTWFDRNESGQKATQELADALVRRAEVRDMSAHYDGHDDLNAYWMTCRGQRPAWVSDVQPSASQGPQSPSGGPGASHARRPDWTR